MTRRKSTAFNENVALKLLGAQMVLSGITTATIEFFQQTYSRFATDRGVSCADAAKHCEISRQQARRHVKVLEDNGIIERATYRSWRFCQDPISDPDLRKLLRLAEENKMYVGARKYANSGLRPRHSGSDQ